MASEASARRSRGASRARPRLKVILALVVATAAVADQPAATLAQTTQPVGPVAGPIPIRSGLAWASGNSGKPGLFETWRRRPLALRTIFFGKRTWDGAVNLMAESAERCAGLWRAGATRQPWHR
jgi:hypothetical protein